MLVQRIRYPIQGETAKLALVSTCKAGVQRLVSSFKTGKYAVFARVELLKSPATKDTEREIVILVQMDSTGCAVSKEVFSLVQIERYQIKRNLFAFPGAYVGIAAESKPATEGGCARW